MIDTCTHIYCFWMRRLDNCIPPIHRLYQCLVRAFYREIKWWKWRRAQFSHQSRSSTHWGWVAHICVCKLTIIDGDNDLSPGRCQAIISTNAGILLNRTLRTTFSETLSKIHTSPFKNMHLKISSRQPCIGLSVLMNRQLITAVI